MPTTPSEGLHYCIAEIVAGIHHLRFALGYLCLGRKQAVVCCLQVEFAYHLLVEQALAAVIVELGCGFLCLCGLEGGFGSAKCSFVGHLVYDEQGLPLAYCLSFGHTELLQLATHLRIYLDILLSSDGGSVLAVDSKVLWLHDHRFVYGRWHLSLLLAAA